MEASNNMTKQRLRTILKERRARLPSKERAERSGIISGLVRSQAWWNKSRIVHIYCSFGTEVQTQGLIQSAFEEQKRVLVPIVSGASNRLEHRIITPQTRFETDSFGIPTPQHNLANNNTNAVTNTITPAVLAAMPCDCVIVPLLGFDVALNRIGYGKGYYDRFLQELLSEASTRPYLIGLAFQCQFVEEGISTEEHDIRLDAVITENGIIADAA